MEWSFAVGIFMFIKGMTKASSSNWWPKPHASSAAVEDKGKKAAPLLPGAEQIALNAALQCKQKPPKSEVSLEEAYYLS